jgi:hypothetical protein
MSKLNQDMIDAKYDTFLKAAEANEQALKKDQPVPITEWTDLELLHEIARLDSLIATNTIARIIVELFEKEYNRRILK